MDYCIASVHRNSFAKGESALACTKLYLEAMKHPKILILGHIGRSGLPFEIDPVLLAAKEQNVLIEINEHSMDEGSETKKRCEAIAVRCAELGVPISVSSDAHIALKIGEYQKVESLLEKIHFPEELIMTRDKESFLQHMKKAGLG